MKSCTQPKIETYFVRFLAAVVVGAIAYVGAEPLAQYFQFDLPDAARWLGTGALALAGWFATKNLVDFTTDCLDVPSAVAPAITSRKQAERPAPSGFRNWLRLPFRRPSSMSVKPPRHQEFENHRHGDQER